jgi:hypothetical protein
MTFEEILDQAIAMLQRRGRVSYRALKRQLDLDDAYVEDVKLELIEVHQVAVDQDNTMLVWTSDAAAPPSPAAAPAADRGPPPDIALYRAMDMTFWLPQTEAALAQVEGR